MMGAFAARGGSGSKRVRWPVSVSEGLEGGLKAMIKLLIFGGIINL
jgi:hypothetical protein